MPKKLAALLLAVVMILTAFTACGNKGNITSGAAKNDYPVTVNNVTIQSEPSGVVVLSPNLADVVLALGYEISLKGKSAECTQKELSVLPSVTAADADAIKKLGANVVLADSSLKSDAADALQKAGIQVVVIPGASSREDLERLYSAVGSVIKGGNTGYTYGQKAAQEIFLSIDDMTRSIPQGDKPIIACYLYDTAGKGATSDTLAGKLIESAGLTNGAGQLTSGKIDIETLLLSDPKYIFCPTGMKEKLKTTEKYKELTAVKQNRVIEMDPGCMEWQGLRMFDAVKIMAGTAYPQLLQSSSSSSTSSQPSSSSISSGKPASSSPASSAASSASSAVSYKTLKEGDKGADVLKMQKRLDELGYMFVRYSGEFTPSTTQAVKDFQYLNGYTVTGIADAKTLQKLYSNDVKKRTN